MPGVDDERSPYRKVLDVTGYDSKFMVFSGGSHQAIDQGEYYPPQLGFRRHRAPKLGNGPVDREQAIFDAQYGYSAFYRERQPRFASSPSPAPMAVSASCLPESAVSMFWLLMTGQWRRSRKANDVTSGKFARSVIRSAA
jgi:hypothetical protein